MQNPIAKIKKTVRANRDEIIVFSTLTAFGMVGVASTCLSIKYMMRNDIVIPAKLVEKLKNSSNGIIGPNVIEGFDIYVKMFPTNV